MLVGEEVLPERFSDDFTRLLRRYQVCFFFTKRVRICPGKSHVHSQAWTYTYGPPEPYRQCTDAKQNAFPG